MKTQLLFLAALLLLVGLFAVCAQGLITRHAPSCLGSKSCVSKDWVSLKRASPGHLLRVIVPVKIKNLELLKNHVDNLNPFSPKQVKHLTFEQIGALTRNQEAIDAVSSYFDQAGVAYDILPNGDYFIAYMNVTTAEKIMSNAFFVHHSRAHNKQVVRAHAYTIPAELEAHITLFGDVISYPATLRPSPVVHAYHKGQKVGQASGTVTPAFFNQFYSVKDNTVKNVQQVTQSLFESLGQSFSPSDLAAFQNQYQIPADKVSKVIGPNSPNSCTSDPNNCVEANLDVQYIMAFAQGAPTTYWSVGSDGDIFLNWILAVAAASDVPLVHSISYGSVEKEEVPTELQQFDQEAMKLGARGVTIMSSSGDDGVANFGARSDPSQCGFSPSFPATATYVLAVGATQGPESGQPEIVCSSSTGGVITSGGGFSTVFDQPSYQTDAVAQYFKTNVTFPPTSQYNQAGRGYPDVALLGYGYQVVIAGSTYSVSGTSCSSPSFAGLVSLVNDARITAGSTPVGFMNPGLYTFAASKTGAFNDITQGENNCCAGESNPVCCQYGFYAAAGWDPVTGYGSVNFDQVLSALIPH